ncbi:MAG: tetratricopeptide repeat protein, partial [Myxococcales bacterium]|nr:tetratricopeptide repeat protein [Myxococcales bacterium]
HEVMPHELGHAFMGDIGDPLLGLPLANGRFNGALIEGVPTALAPRPADNLGPHEQAAILDRLDKRPPLASIMGAGFYGAAASRAYTAAGSFVLWLAQTRGWAVVAQLYANGGDFRASTGESVAELEVEWLAFLRKIPLRQQDIDAQAQRFERGSVFSRPCAHRVARLMADAGRARIRQEQDLALESQQTLCSIEPEHPGHFLGLASMQAQWGDLAGAAATLEALAGRDDLTSVYRALIEEQRGDTAMLAGALADAGERYAAALEYGQNEARRRQLQIKLRASEDPRLAPLVMDYFAPFEPDVPGPADAMLKLWTAMQIRALPGHFALGNYLAGRLYLNIAAPEEALGYLELAQGGDPPGEEPLWTLELRREAAWTLTSALVQTREWTRARAVLDVLESIAEGEGHRMDVAHWRARVDFFEGWFE